MVFTALAGVGCMAYDGLIHTFTGWNPDMIFTFGVLTTGVSGYMIYKEFRQKTSKWNRLFKNCGIKNMEEQMPILISKKNKGNGKEYIFTVPVGLSEENFEKKKAAIECFLKSNVQINRRGSTVSITALASD